MIACTFDPLGLHGPLQTWLHALTGLRCTLSWVGYGLTIETLRDDQSAWNANRDGVNFLLVRASDLHRRDGASDAAADAASDAALLDALRGSQRRRRGPTIVLVPPVSSAPGAASAEAAASAEDSSGLVEELGRIRGVRVHDADALRVLLGSLRFHSAFLDRVAHAPYSAAGCSVFASVICRELSRALAPKKKVYCLDCDNTLWGGAVGELGALDCPLIAY